MSPEFAFNPEAAHAYFSTYCFNTAWELIEKADRTSADDEAMVRLAHTSIWHWTQRPDCTPRHLSVGYWQLSRIYSLLGEAENARRYARLALEAGEGQGPFFVGYAYEALARAEQVAGNEAQKGHYLEQALRLADEVPDPEEKKLLAADLESLQP
ncbi:MAG TPA: hypothetical protein VI793_12955 [Anaerolineales bacterium]|nr:hypothetical protein [Anaerolineales bacterium]